ncbi:MAG: AraC family transcriptional regulator [Lentisphaerae bacterium]|nr:AraC family transcriptional regulator [Lentisphaerota bacterium]
MKQTAVRFNNGAAHNCPPEWSWTFGPMSDYDLWVVLDGHGWFYINGKSYELRTGDIMLLTPGSYGHAEHELDSPLRVMAVHFDFIEGAPEPEVLYLYLRCQETSFLEQMLWRSVNAGINNKQNDADFWLTAVLKEILPEICHGEFSVYQNKVEKLCNEIAVHPEKNISIKEMAARFNICKDHFSRVFKKLKGCSPQQYLIKVKIEQAYSLLLNSNLTVSEIAEELSYTSVNYFCRQFKAERGITPRQVRSQTK